MKTELLIAPSFTFEQENADGLTERPVTVVYYNDDLVCLEQSGKSITLCGNQMKELFREIIRHHPEAQKALKK
jgi:predicted deacetylase